MCVVLMDQADEDEDVDGEITIINYCDQRVGWLHRNERSKNVIITAHNGGRSYSTIDNNKLTRW